MTDSGPDLFAGSCNSSVGQTEVCKNLFCRQIFAEVVGFHIVFVIHRTVDFLSDHHIKLMVVVKCEIIGQSSGFTQFARIGFCPVRQWKTAYIGSIGSGVSPPVLSFIEPPFITGFYAEF